MITATNLVDRVTGLSIFHSWTFGIALLVVGAYYVYYLVRLCVKVFIWLSGGNPKGRDFATFDDIRGYQSARAAHKQLADHYRNQFYDSDLQFLLKLDASGIGDNPELKAALAKANYIHDKYQEYNDNKRRTEFKPYVITRNGRRLMVVDVAGPSDDLYSSSKDIPKSQDNAAAAKARLDKISADAKRAEQWQAEHDLQMDAISIETSTLDELKAERKKVLSKAWAMSRAAAAEYGGSSKDFLQESLKEVWEIQLEREQAAAARQILEVMEQKQDRDVLFFERALALYNEKYDENGNERDLPKKETFDDWIDDDLDNLDNPRAWKQ